VGGDKSVEARKAGRFKPLLGSTMPRWGFARKHVRFECLDIIIICDNIEV